MAERETFTPQEANEIFGRLATGAERRAALLRSKNHPLADWLAEGEERRAAGLRATQARHGETINDA